MLSVHQLASFRNTSRSLRQCGQGIVTSNVLVWAGVSSTAFIQSLPRQVAEVAQHQAIYSTAFTNPAVTCFFFIHLYHLWRIGVQCGCTRSPTLHLMRPRIIYYRFRWSKSWLLGLRPISNTPSRRR